MTVFQENPKSGAISTISAFLLGMLPNVEPALQTLVLFWFQLIAFAVTIVVGVLTAISYYLKLKDRKTKSHG